VRAELREWSLAIDVVIFAPLTQSRPKFESRRSVFQARGYFPPSSNIAVSVFFAPVAQLDRAPGYEPGGRGFESLRAHQYSMVQEPRLVRRPRAAGTAAISPGAPNLGFRQFPGLRASGLAIQPSVTDRLLNPELVHSDKRIRILSLKACPVTQISAGRVVGKAYVVLMLRTGIQLEPDEVEPEFR
jgi:hypothetical protein